MRGSGGGTLIDASAFALPSSDQVTLHGQFLAHSLWWEAGDWQADPSAYLVGDTVYLFWSALALDGLTRIGYASCSLSDYTADPANLVKHAEPIISPSGTPGAPDRYIVTAQQLVHLPAGGWRLYAHGYDGTYGKGLLYTCSEVEFPNTWHGPTMFLDVGPAGSHDGLHVFPQAIAPPWEGTSSGMWEIFYAACPAGGVPWTGNRAYSPDGLTCTKDSRNPIMHAGGEVIAFDRTGFLPLGQPHNHNGVWRGTYQGYNDTTWTVGIYTTRDFSKIQRSVVGPLLIPPSGLSTEGPSISHIVPGRADIWYCVPRSFTPSPGTGGGSNYELYLASYPYDWT